MPRTDRETVSVDVAGQQATPFGEQADRMTVAELLSFLKAFCHPEEQVVVGAFSGQTFYGGASIRLFRPEQGPVEQKGPVVLGGLFDQPEADA